MGETNRLKRQGSRVIRCKHGAEPSNRVSVHQSVSWTHGLSPFDVTIHAREYRGGNAADDVAYHCSALGFGSVVSPDKPVDATDDVETGQVIWRKSLTFNAKVGIFRK